LKRLVQICGFRDTHNFAKYFGLSLTGKTPKRVGTFFSIEQRAKLLFWKANQFSFVGRVILAKSIL